MIFRSECSSSKTGQSEARPQSTGLVDSSSHRPSSQALCRILHARVLKLGYTEILPKRQPNGRPNTQNAFAIDTVSFEFQIMDQLQEAACTAGPSDGCYIKGLFLEGARWDADQHTLAESQPKELFASEFGSATKELFTEMPMVWLSLQKCQWCG